MQQGTALDNTGSPRAQYGVRALCGAGVVLALCLLCGCSSSGGGAAYTAPNTTPPTVSDFAITAPQNGWQAGNCIIQLRATDKAGVATVTATVSGPNINGGSVPMQLVSGSGNLYQGSVAVPSNVSATGITNTYFVTAWATDTAGNSTSVAQSLSFSIPPPQDAPVAPPSSW